MVGGEGAVIASFQKAAVMVGEEEEEGGVRKVLIQVLIAPPKLPPPLLPTSRVASNTRTESPWGGGQTATPPQPTERRPSLETLSDL